MFFTIIFFLDLSNIHLQKDALPKRKENWKKGFVSFYQSLLSINLRTLIVFFFRAS